MKQIAFDIAILPPDEIQDICIELCHKYQNNSGRPPLNKKDNTPHISLLMGVVEEKKLPELIEQTKKILKDKKTINLKIEKIQKIDSTYYFPITKNKKLQELHELFVNQLPEFHSQKTTADMYLDDIVADSTYFWTDNYAIGSSFAKFWSHITLKACDNPEFKTFPLEFNADKIAICHMGNHCTCRKILWQSKLINK